MSNIKNLVQPTLEKAINLPPLKLQLRKPFCYEIPFIKALNQTSLTVPHQ
ncbi:hypothetical protein GBA52_008364 [Prunus armeniaca]|nr:hypothetical protein GBA52_008364 [Prunus armeniaca]